MSESTSREPLSAVVVGAGPVGLAAAAHLVERGLEPAVLEAGPSAASSVRAWGHVRLFSPWSELVDPAAARLLEPTGWQRPPDGHCPTGAEWAELYLQPLADALGDRVRYETTVIGVARRGRDRVVDSGRADQPFTVHTRRSGGSGGSSGSSGSSERGEHGDPSDTVLTTRAIVDASGTFTTPNPLGADGLPATGERALADRISYLSPDMADPATRTRHAGRRTAVVGSGHSALTALIALADLAKNDPGTRAVWVLRRDTVERAFGGGENDQLPARGALGLKARQAVADGHIEVVHGFRVEAVEEDGSRLVLVADDGRRLEDLDEVIALTGFRPDHSWETELRLSLDERLQAPAALAPLIDPNIHSCGTVPPHGAAELAHAEEGVYLVGMKSYGRAPTFLAITGYEQVRSVAAALAGDHEAAGRVELTLPETGVCGGAGLPDITEIGPPERPGAKTAPGGEGSRPAVPVAAEAGGCC
ncbi:FAD-dependent oxidoreductase [Streptomyces sp. URMC 123]|uniref:FAD-dependent oxidoreductase n=1 Tax=Streptomyces sp. URMC 123 TaxID=3423403 RepID=UPI003F1D4F09